MRYWLECLDGHAGSVQIWNFASPYPFGLDLATSDAEMQRIFWTHLGTRSPWTWAGLPSHWALGSTVALGADATAGDTSISVTGLDASKIAVVQGQYVQVGRRLYIATATTSSDASGDATITITPGLLADASTGAEVRLVEAACEMFLLDKEIEESAAAGGGFSQVSATFRETVADYA